MVSSGPDLDNFGAERDPPAYWRRLGQLMLTIPVGFLLTLGVTWLLRLYGVAYQPAIAIMLPMPILAMAFFGIQRQELPLYWNYVIKGRLAQKLGRMALIAYFCLVVALLALLYFE
jgi:hypothetical protein